MQKVWVIIGLYIAAFIVASVGINLAFADCSVTAHAGMTALVFILSFFSCALQLMSPSMQKALNETMQADD